VLAPRQEKFFSDSPTNVFRAARGTRKSGPPLPDTRIFEGRPSDMSKGHIPVAAARARLINSAISRLGLLDLTAVRLLFSDSSMFSKVVLPTPVWPDPKQCGSPRWIVDINHGRRIVLVAISLV